MGKEELLSVTNEVGGSILRRGGGAVDMEIRSFPSTSVGAMLVVHMYFDTRDAMGANAINTAVEHVAPRIQQLIG